MKYTVDDYGLLLGLVSVPPGTDEKDFYNTDIASNLVMEYKAARTRNSFDDKKPSDVIYKPIGFKTFGENDLMFYTLFDDFAYPNRVFHPFHGNGHDNAKYCNFDYQLVVGINIPDKSPKLQHIFSKCGIDKYLFTCATRFKINPLLLCGTGLHCIELIKSQLRALHDSNTGIIILLNGVGCDELLMLNFSNIICDIAKFIFKVRNLQFQSLKDSEPEELYDLVKNECIGRLDTDMSLEEAHVFSSSYSVSGFAFHRDGLPENTADGKFSLQFTWIVKPGHIGSFTNKLYKAAQKLKLKMQRDKLFINNALVSLTIESDLLRTTAELIDTIDSLRNLDPDKSDIRKLHVSVSVEDDEHYLIPEEDGSLPRIAHFDSSKHPSTRRFFSEQQFTADKMATLRAILDKAHISKVLKERIMKMYQNFNDCVQDPQFVVSFLGLRPFLSSIIKVVDSYTKDNLAMSATDLHEWLDSAVRDFEQAYLNRFHQSNRMRALSDFNLEWNGGIQQLICSMDFAYKTLMRNCGVPDPDAFMYVSGHERVHVTDHSYRINMQHITYPELFVSTMWKEFFNFLPLKSGLADSNGILPFRKIINDAFAHALRDRMGSSLKFNSANDTHRTLLKQIDKEFLACVVADLMTFHIGYNESLDDFSFWYIRYMLQTPGVYNHDGTVCRDDFIKFFCRIILVYKLVDAKEETMLKMSLNAPDPSIAGLWISTFKDVHTIATLLRDILASYNFADIVDKMTTKMLLTTLHNDTPADTKLPPKKLAEVLKDALQDIQGEFHKFFAEDTIPTEITEQYLTTGLLPAFLKHLRTIITEKNAPCISLSRSPNGHPGIDAETAQFYCALLADPLGGSFSICTDMHVRYFKARSVLYMAMFHFYHRYIYRPNQH